jgi:hypothetical protein
MKDQAFIGALVNETVIALKRSAGCPESIRGVVFLYLNRAYDNGLTADSICDLFGSSTDSILTRAAMGKTDEIAVMDAYEALDPIVEKQYGAGTIAPGEPNA